MLGVEAGVWCPYHPAEQQLHMRVLVRAVMVLSVVLPLVVSFDGSARGSERWWASVPVRLGGRCRLRFQGRGLQGIGGG